MNDFDSIIKRMTVTRLEPGDYTGEDGLLYCGKCRTPKQFRMDAPPLEGRLLPHAWIEKSKPCSNYCTNKSKQSSYKKSHSLT